VIAGGSLLARTRLCRLVSVSMLLAAAAGCAYSAAAAAPGLPHVTAVVLPRDHGAHAGFQSEWWYTAGTLADSAGHPYFWFATAWAAQAGMIARVNVVDLRQDRIVLAQQYLSLRPPAQGQTSMRVGAFRLGWRRGGALGRWSVAATTAAGRLELRLVPGQPYVLHGTHGIIQQGPGGLSAYYSEPRLAARGVLELGRRSIGVHGEGWFDHQWGNFLADPGALRWNWFACQLRDGRSLMLYQFLDRHDRPSGIVAGTLAYGSGRVKHLRRFSATGLSPFVRPSGARARYPLRWRLHVPALKLTLTLRSRARHQYIVNQLIPSFWEGAAAITSGPPGSCIVESSREVPAKLAPPTASELSAALPR
jgi:predicted secreted hydrolase